MLITVKKLIKFIDPYFKAQFSFLFYKTRFLLLYITFGFFSILIEILIRNQLIHLKLDTILSTVIAITFGIIFAFYCNVNYNFKITKSRRNRALIYFNYKYL